MAKSKRGKMPSIADIERLLDDGMPWPAGFDPERAYLAHQDDNDGEEDSWIKIAFSPDGDVWLTADGVGPYQSLRYRTEFGGAQNHRVRNALMLVAYAIHMGERGRLEG